MIPPDTLARIKERTDIVALIGETVKLTRRGRSFIGLCPFHKEKSPSFHVHLERGFFHCFGCQESGSAIDFLMKTNGLEFLEAVQTLADKAGIVIERTASSEGARAHKSERDELYAVNLLAATYWEQCLGLSGTGRPHPLAGYGIRELQKRGMPAPGTESEDAERWGRAATAFKLGYAPPGWDGLAAFLKQQGVSPVVGERAGLLVPGPRAHYDRFRHRLMFAVVDTMGRVIAFSGRALETPSKEDLAKHAPHAPSYDGEPPAKYINSPESPVYKKGDQLFGLHQAKQGMRQRQEAILVEGNFDVVTLHARGIDNAVAPLGTAFTPDQAKLLKRFAPTVVVLFDGDAAGRKATRAARTPCREGGLEAKVAVLPNGKDPDDFVRSEGAPALLAVVKDAKGMLEHLIHAALAEDRFGGAAMTERVARVREVTKLLADEPDPNLRLMAKRFADQLSSKLIVGNAPAQDLGELERLIANALRQADSPRPHGPGPSRPGPQGPSQGKPSASPPRLTTEGRFALDLFGALLDFPSLLLDPVVSAKLDLLEGDLALATVAVRRKLVREESSAAENTLDAADFLATLPASIQSFSAGRLASPIFDDASEAKTYLLETASKLEGTLQKRQKASKIGLLERSSSLDSEAEALLRELQAQARRRKGLE